LQNRWPFAPIPLPAGKWAKTTKKISEVEKNRSRRLFCKYLARRLQQKGVYHHPFSSWSVDISFKDDVTVILLLGVFFMQKPTISKSNSAQGEITGGFQEIELGQQWQW
jgi:hypothetical protein